MICKPSCITDSPSTDLWNSCNITKRKGGVPRALFLKCDPDFVLPNVGGWSNLDNWEYALCQGNLLITGNILGQKPKGSTTKKRTQSCGPEEVTSGTKTVTWQDYNAEPADLLDFDFYEWVIDNQKFLKFGWISCDELVYMFNGNWSLEGDYVQEDSEDGNTFFDAAVTMSQINVIKPISVPGVLALLESYNSVYC